MEKKFIAVAIRKSGHAAVSKPYATLEEAMAELKPYVIKHFNEVAMTTYMIRECETLADIFGKPKSRDLMQDRKFLKEVSA